MGAAPAGGVVRVSIQMNAVLLMLAATVSDLASAAKPYVSMTPVAADWAALAKLPDFNGVWEVYMGPPPKMTAGSKLVLPSFMMPPVIKLTPAFEARKQALINSGSEDSGMANCVPPGMPTLMTQPYPMEFLMTPGKITIIAEALMQVRHIYTDGRPLPKDPDPAFNGHSIGHWEEGTLVVETMGLNTATQLSTNVEHGPNTRIVERIHLSDADTMVIETTVSDPDALAEPWKITLPIKRHREYTITEYICQQNNRNFVTPDGKAGINLNNP
jgi:hypothetical protein